MAKPELNLSPESQKFVIEITEDEDLNYRLVMNNGCVIYRTEHGWLADRHRNSLLRGSTELARYQKTAHEAWNAEREDKTPLFDDRDEI